MTNAAPDQQLEKLAGALAGMADSLAVLRKELDARERVILAERANTLDELLREHAKPTRFGRPRAVLAGKTFKGLTVIEDLGTARTGAIYRVRCSCGKETLVASAKLLRGEVVSCGECRR